MPKEMPTRAVVAGIEYRIEHCDNPAEVGADKREAHWGEINFRDRTIRIYKGKRPHTDLWWAFLWRTLQNELTDQQLHLKLCDEHEGEMDSLILMLMNTFVRNGWLKIGEDE